MVVPQLGFLDRCIFTAIAGGTGPFGFASAVPGFQSPSAAGIVNGQQYGYTAQAVDLSQWEYGYGTWNSGAQTLSRTVLGNSSNNTSPINFTQAPNVLITLLAESMAQVQAGAIIPATGNLDFYVNGTTGSDSNPGTVGSPFATIAHAALVAESFDYGYVPFSVVIHVADGTYNEPIPLNPLFPAGEPTGTFLGNPANPGNVIINAPIACGGAGYGNWFVQGFRLIGTTWCIGLESGMLLDTDDIILDVGFVGVFLSIGAGIGFGSFGGANGTTFNSGAGSHFALIEISLNSFTLFNGGPVNFPGAISFTGAVLWVDGAANLQFPSKNYGFMTGGGNVTSSQFHLGSASSYDTTTSGNRSNILGSTRGTIVGNAIIIQDPPYEIFTPSSGGTVTPTPGSHQLILNPAAASLATLTVNLPTNMTDAETVTVSTTKTITALTFATTDGSTIVANPANITLAWGSRVTFIFDANNTSWYV